MRRTAAVLSGSACCVYGLTFTSHFYGARRTVGYVPFNSETLVTGKLFEDIREAVFKLADPDKYERSSSSIFACRPRPACPCAAAERDRRRAHHRHRCAGLRRADACGGQGRARRRNVEFRSARAEQGPVQARARRRAESRRLRCLAGFPRRLGAVRLMLELLLRRGRWRRPPNGANFMARWIAPLSPQSIPSIPLACANSKPRAARHRLGPGRRRGTASGSTPSPRSATSSAPIDAAKAKLLPAIKGALAAAPISGRMTLSGYEAPS